MRFKNTLATLAMAATATLILASGVAAQQVPSPPQQAPQAAGGFGPTWMAASIAADGTHVPGTGGAGLVSSAKINALGGYEVVFRRKISLCIVQGTIGRHGVGTEPPGFLDISQRSGNDKAYFVQTRDLAGAQVDLPFFLVVFCTT